MEKTGNGKRMKELRKSAGFTQDQLAEMMGVAKTTVSAWERDIQNPSINTLSIFCELVGITLDDFFSNKPRSIESIEENAVWLDAQPEVPDLKALFKRFLQLDRYGKDAVKNLINSELYRCESTGTIQDANNYFIDVRYIDED